MDLSASIADMDIQEKKKKKPPSDEEKKAFDEKKAAVRNLLNQCGQYLYFVVYEREAPSFLFFKKKVRQGLIAFRDQLASINSADGTLICLGEGTQKIGIYFQMLSGYNERVEVVLTHLITSSRIRLTTTLEGNIINMVEKSINLDTTFMKLAELSLARNNPMGGEGGGEKKA